MATVECVLTDSLMRPVAQPPVLSVVIPTFFRPVELAYAVHSIAGQIDAELDGKVEIIITDNASGPETAAVLKQLAETYPCVSYMIHAKNEGGVMQVLAAPFRARGRWTWVFGDDDALAEGGLKLIVELLEREQPAFLTINRQVWNKTFTELATPSRHDLDDRRFDTFLDMLDLFGFDQLSFFTSQVYSSAEVRALEPTLYHEATCRYAQLPYYVEAFHGLPAYYMSAPVVRHRWDPDAKDTHSANFHHLATFLPRLLDLAAQRAGLEPGPLFERIGGRRSLTGPAERPKVNFVDNILENLWRCVAVGEEIQPYEWDILQGLSGGWRPDRAGQLAAVREVSANVMTATHHYYGLVAEYTRIAEAASRTEAEIATLDQIETAVKSLQGTINEARQFGMDMAAQFK